MFAGGVRYLVWWGSVFALQWLFAATWLIDSRTGLQTVLQVLPAVIVAIFVLVLGSLFVIAQQAVAAHGTRAAMILPAHPAVQALLVRPLLITALALLLAGQVPDSGSIDDPVAAAVTTGMLATVALLVRCAVVLPSVFLELTAPVVFAQRVVEGLVGQLRRGATGLVVFRVGLLTEMLGQAVKRGDSRAITAALHGLDSLHEQYIAAAESNPAARRHRYASGTEAVGWLGDEMVPGLVAAAEDALALQASEEDVVGILDTLERLGERALKSGHAEEAGAAIRGLADVGTCVQQVQQSGVVNHPARTLTNLAQLEGVAEAEGNRQIAAEALEAMMVVTAYVQTHFNLEHWAWDHAIDLLGPEPPFAEAGDAIESRASVERWSNKMPPLPDGVLVPVGNLQRAMEQHAGLHDKPCPSMPPKEGPPWWVAEAPQPREIP